MKKYLITHTATVGRKKVDGAEIAPVELLFYSIVEAATTEAASDQVVQYSDPGFISKVSNVSELGEGMTTDELHGLLEHKKVLVESRV